MADASTALFKKNGGLNHERKRWKEYPVGTKSYRDNWDATFKEPEVPNPGSKEAQAMDCTCPVLDNNHGNGFPYGMGTEPCFYINAECPIHVKPRVRRDK